MMVRRLSGFGRSSLFVNSYQLADFSVLFSVILFVSGGVGVGLDFRLRGNDEGGG